MADNQPLRDQLMLFDIHCLEETGSTNDDVKQAADKGAAEGTVVWALRQSAGRGRGGRRWQSPEGNLYFSILLRPEIPLKRRGLYSFVIALAVSDVLQDLVPESTVELKWPNDVLVNGKKIAGILLEGGEGWLVAGIGVNVMHHPDNPLYPVTSFAQEKAAIKDLRVVLDRVLEALGNWYERMNAEGFAPIREAWLSRARKGIMKVRLPNGTEDAEIQGRFADLDNEGNLCLILADGSLKTISTGDVFF